MYWYRLQIKWDYKKKVFSSAPSFHISDETPLAGGRVTLLCSLATLNMFAL
jgi:hypothetical protein